eukprot:scaffold13123_cov112-Isochrysis_galbana.AAC.4
MRARRSSFSWSSSRFSETLRDRNDNLGRLAARLPSSAGTAATSPTDICRICTLCSSNCVSLDRVMSPAKQCLDARPSALWPSASAEAPSSASTAVLATGKPLCVVERSISRTKPTVVSVSCRTCTLVAMMERAERIQLSASAVEVAVDRSKAAPPSSIWMSYSEIVKRSPTSLDERIASMIGRSSQRDCHPSDAAEHAGRADQSIHARRDARHAERLARVAGLEELAGEPADCGADEHARHKQPARQRDAVNEDGAEEVEDGEAGEGAERKEQRGHLIYLTVAADGRLTNGGRRGSGGWGAFSIGLPTLMGHPGDIDRDRVGQIERQIIQGTAGEGERHPVEERDHQRD